jgi:UDP-N-acetyl-D-mannosaminuronic acid transferase (WecB/TagA/CpsF family)
MTKEEIPETLSKFRKLRTLVITGHHGYFQSSDPSELLAKLEEACPLLHTVAFYGRDRRWLRWEFSGSGWRKIDAAEDIDPWDQSVRDLAF